MVEITEADLRKLYDFDAEAELVRMAVFESVRGPDATIRFIGRYAAWNGWFGSGVASLAAKIGRGRDLFRDPAEPISALADRSVLVGSYFFDAARDEFDDRDTAHRDTHRCLAQALLKGVLQYFRTTHAYLEDLPTVEALLVPPLWHDALCARVSMGYGNGLPDTLPSIFRAIGYHVGSEVLADREFSTIDRALRDHAPALVDYLGETSVEIAGQSHRAYQWLSIHSGHGGAVEAEHFAWATKGANLAFSYVPSALHDALLRQLQLGFIDFARDHQEFFEGVTTR